MENFLLQSLGCTLTDELEPGARQKVVAVSPAAQKKVFYYQLEILKLKISVIIREKETESLEVKGRQGWLFFFCLLIMVIQQPNIFNWTSLQVGNRRPLYWSHERSLNTNCVWHLYLLLYHTLTKKNTQQLVWTLIWKKVLVAMVMLDNQLPNVNKPFIKAGTWKREWGIPTIN